MGVEDRITLGGAQRMCPWRAQGETAPTREAVSHFKKISYMDRNVVEAAGVEPAGDRFRG